MPAYYLLPVASALIGWLTNFIAIKMLFHPREPRSFLGFSYQGIFPQRRPQLATKVAIIVERELISPEDIQAIIEDPAFIEPIRQAAHARVEAHIRSHLAEKLNAFGGMARILVSDKMCDRLTHWILKQVDETFDASLPGMAHALENRLEVRALVERKLNSFPMEKIEEMLFSVMRREFRFIEIAGGVLGFAIGMVQALFLHFAAA